VSLPIPLSVRLVTTRADRHITRDLRDITFRESAVGGFASATMSLDRPLTLQPDEIAYYGRVYIYDTRNGRTVWEGRLEDPGRGAGSDGQIWDLTAMGPSAHAKDRTVPLVYADTTLSRWQPSGSSSRYMSVSNRGDSTPAIQIKVDDGATWATSGQGTISYRTIADAGMVLARVYTDWDAGFASSNVTVSLRTSLDNGSTTEQDSDTADTAGGDMTAVRGTNLTAGHNWALLRLVRNASSSTGDENAWVDFSGIVLRSLLKDKSGSDITSGYTLNTVLASEVVADLLGRLLTSFDGANATVATTSYAINQLAYPDGVTAAQVFDDLMRLEPAYRWGAYESNAAGKHRFEWAAWPTTVRYEADVLDGYDAPGSADGLYNAVTVRWRDTGGTIRTTPRTSTVAELTAAGLTRTAFVDLGDEVGSSADATRAGDQFLAERQYAPNAGRLTVARPVLDLVTGRMVAPWEIKAGELIRVRGILPRLDALNATARDGVTVFRVWSKTYSAASASAVLELDSYSASTARSLATLTNRPVTRRR